jgi:hypothetical protein
LDSAALKIAANDLAFITAFRLIKPKTRLSHEAHQAHKERLETWDLNQLDLYFFVPLRALRVKNDFTP